MYEVTRILEKASSGDRLAAEELLPILYDELRRIATSKLARELPGQTLQATALVHEAYFRLIGPSNPHWNSRAHFFGAAAEAMRRILVEQARRQRRSREFQSAPADALPEIACHRTADQDRILDVDAALNTLAASDPQAAEIVKLHFFAGLTLDEVAQALSLSRATIYRDWAYARAQLKLILRDGKSG
ncbi:MAG: sigma-70 family RNA polymerase sigma factor [Pirellulaceae bacterium]|nr:sigma-70 family RNA polymerase sigma factor [Pirellulaceae bacterium]